MLYRFCDPVEVQHIPLLLQCLNLMFHETKQLSIERVASFVKRLSNLALYVPPFAALALMHAVRLCLNKYPKVKQLLDREATASGIHLAEMDDPDLANSFASTLWELGLLKANYHPFIPVYASSILADEALPLALARTTPLQLFENYDSSEGGFNPPLPLPMLFSSTGGAGGSNAPTSASMKKKLDLKRRIMMHQLSASRYNERLQSPFLQQCNEESRKRKRDDDQASGVKATLTPQQMQEKLQSLKSISTLYNQHKMKQRKVKAAPAAASAPSASARPASANKSLAQKPKQQRK